MKPPGGSILLIRALAVWVALLLLSTGVRWLRGFESANLRPGEYAELSDQAPSEGAIAWREFTAKDPDGSLPVVLLHGNPVAGKSLVPLARELQQHRIVLVPDLPGFGYSARPQVGYGARQQIPALREWFAERGFSRAHWVGYSQGSVTALEMARQYPDLVSSVTLLAGVGLQEHELFGDYRLNQPVYLLEYGALWALRWLTPHFGLLDHPWLSPRTAINFMETDLRESRTLLDSVSQPVRILHSVDDRLVPFEAARAHAEIVPQAEFSAIGGGHLAPIRNPGEVAYALSPFFDSVERETAVTRVDAMRDGPPAKPALALEAGCEASAFNELFFGVLLFVLVFLSEDLACIAAGLLAAKGVISFGIGAGACFLGIWISDIGLYLMGYFLGPAVYRIRLFRKSAKRGRVRAFTDAYERHGAKIIFLTRFLPGSRVPAYVTAGVLRVGLLRFAFWLGVAALLWTPLLVGVAFLVGNPLIGWWERSGWIVLPLIAAILVLSFIAVRLATECFTHKGRRLLYGRWLRWTRWEFWPMWPVYLPVLARCAFLSLKHRSATVWAAVNPGIDPAGGLVLESKSAILRGLSARPDRIARWHLIEPGENTASRLRTVERFQSDLAEAWPLVLKPDTGQRGEGVAILRTPHAVERYLSGNKAAVIAQEYVPGHEFGVFYYRFPGEGAGHLFSITEKVLPELEGDGARTLEDLILDDARAVALAAHYLKVNRARLADVPAEGETVRLVELGTHCRGALFLDGNRWKTEALRRALDEVVSGFEGFHFGRFDLRVPSGEALSRGEGFRILELNGVSSEATDIYDPRHSILHAWKVLSRQWALAYAIGAGNRQRGAPVPSVRDLLKLLRAYRRRTVFDADAGRFGHVSAGEGELD